jgi:hypothetical protein
MARHITSDPIDVIFDAKDKSKVIYTSEAQSGALPMLSEKVALESILARYDYQLVNSTNQMRQFILANLFRLAEETEDEKTKLKTLETLGRVTEIGLFTNKIEIAIADKPTSDLEVELRGLLKNYAKVEKQVAEEITDEELRGYDQIEEDDLMDEAE